MYIIIIYIYTDMPTIYLVYVYYIHIYIYIYLFIWTIIYIYILPTIHTHIYPLCFSFCTTSFLDEQMGLLIYLRWLGFTFGWLRNPQLMDGKHPIIYRVYPIIHKIIHRIIPCLSHVYPIIIISRVSTILWVVHWISLAHPQQYQYPGVHATDLEEDAEFEVPIYGKEKNTIG